MFGIWSLVLAQTFSSLLTEFVGAFLGDLFRWTLTWVTGLEIRNYSSISLRQARKLGDMGCLMSSRLTQIHRKPIKCGYMIGKFEERWWFANFNVVEHVSHGTSYNSYHLMLLASEAAHRAVTESAVDRVIEDGVPGVKWPDDQEGWRFTDPGAPTAAMCPSVPNPVQQFILDKVLPRIKEGSGFTIGLFGAMGVGKSTLIDLITRSLGGIRIYDASFKVAVRTQGHMRQFVSAVRSSPCLSKDWNPVVIGFDEFDYLIKRIGEKEKGGDHTRDNGSLKGEINGFFDMMAKLPDLVSVLTCNAHYSDFTHPDHITALRPGRFHMMFEIHKVEERFVVKVGQPASIDSWVWEEHEVKGFNTCVDGTWTSI
jgi:ATPase family associated with various cellular activities (AAA)